MGPHVADFRREAASTKISHEKTRDSAVYIKVPHCQRARVDVRGVIHEYVSWCSFGHKMKR